MRLYSLELTGPAEPVGLKKKTVLWERPAVNLTDALAMARADNWPSLLPALCPAVVVDIRELDGTPVKEGPNA